MKNNLFLILLFFPRKLFAEDLNIEAKNIKIDKKNQISIFENDVIIKDNHNIIQSDFAKYDNLRIITIRKNIILEDKVEINFMVNTQLLIKTKNFYNCWKIKYNYITRLQG